MLESHSECVRNGGSESGWLQALRGLPIDTCSLSMLTSLPVRLYNVATDSRPSEL